MVFREYKVYLICNTRFYNSICVVLEIQPVKGYFDVPEVMLPFKHY